MYKQVNVFCHWTVEQQQKKGRNLLDGFGTVYKNNSFDEELRKESKLINKNARGLAEYKREKSIIFVLYI